jgi:hypothetical protein
MRVVMMTPMHQEMTTTIQMMIQSQPSPQTHHHLSLAMRSRYFT